MADDDDNEPDLHQLRRSRRIGSLSSSRNFISNIFEISSDSESDAEIYTSDEDDKDEDEFSKSKINQVGDGTNDSLEALREDDLLKIKENRQVREYPDPPDGNVQCNPESYFLAAQRVKYKKKKIEPVLTRKPRKGNRTGKTGEEQLPERSTSNFSVTVELATLSQSFSTASITRNHEEEIENLENDIAKEFPHWIFILRENFNIILHGYGSKESILRRFKVFVDEFLVIDINGLFPKLNARKLLLGFWESLDSDELLPPAGNNILAMAEDMYSILARMEHPSVFFFVHSLDRFAMNQPKLFNILCSLSRIKFIHIIGTVDHINATLAMDQNQIISLNLYWINCTTFSPYDTELRCKRSIFSEIKEDQTTKSSLEHVLKSLTVNARKAFGILVDLQLKSMTASGHTKTKDFPGIPFQELARKCRESFVAHNEMGLRTLLTEFVDHKLIRYTGKSKKIDNKLLVDLDIQTLQRASTI